MNNAKSNLTVDKFAVLVDEFYSNQDPKEAIMKIFVAICNILNIDKLSVITRNDDLDKYLTMYEYSSKNGFINHSEILNVDMKQCVNTSCNYTDNNREILKQRCSNKQYLYTTDYLEIEAILANVGFNVENIDTLKETYVYLASCSELFTYSVFEVHNEQKLSETDIEILTAACRIIDAAIINMTKMKKYENDMLMKDIILDYEEIPIASVEKDTFRVLYHNKAYYDVLPNIKTGAICYELMGYSEKCSDCCMDKDLLVTPKDSGHLWIKKAVPFKMSNGKEAYMIYSKNNTDYVNQLKAVDDLTESLLIRGFEEYYGNFIQRSNDMYALCSLDIDKFKYVNNIFGYQVGDDVLKKTAIVIRDFIGIHENFCRVGEDKFSLFLQYEDENDLHLKIRKLSNEFLSMKDEYFPDARITVIGGVTLVDKSLNFQTLLDQSTTARKSGKGSHKNKFSYYDPALDLKVKKEMKIEERIPFALANDEFIAYLQPKFDLHTKTICGAEALVRWSTVDGMIFPDEFIPLFERNGFILTLDFIVYEKVMQFIRKCLDDNLPVYPISVNVSRNHINDKNFLKKFMTLLTKYDVPCKYLELEVTESVFVEDKTKLKKFINEIKAQNLKISIDDFGTAYSSLQTLTDINVDILKIDKGFLDNIVLSEQDSETKDEILLKNIILIKNIIHLAKELEFKVICEGVETDGQIELLKNIGCELGQGYVFAKPMTIADYTKSFIF